LKADYLHRKHRAQKPKTRPEYRENTMSDESQKARLRQHFAHRVTTQARLVLDRWQKIHANPGQAAALRDDFTGATDKLVRFARRFEMESYCRPGQQVLRLIADWPRGEALPDNLLQPMEESIRQLYRNTQPITGRQAPEAPRQFDRTPVYIALASDDMANRLSRKLELFGLRAVAFHTREDLMDACSQHKPDTIVMDVNFGSQPLDGIATVEKLQERHDSFIPIIFLSSQDGSIETRLRTLRCGGEEFFYPAPDTGQLLEKVELHICDNTVKPYRVLVLDDSRAQAKYVETVLKKAGMTVCVITDPMQIITALDSFLPEIIILDMYMPGCTGTEIARVIRQQDRFHRLPILYLSAEDDIGKQLHAMSLGGDDFLTKPIDPRHLISTIHNRGQRARSLLALMVRDSLTGLFNHSHTLNLLDQEIVRASEQEHALSFVILDIDDFRKVNDTFGHPIGDRVLRRLSMLLNQRLRKSDLSGRYSGGGFAIILPQTGANDTRKLLDEIRARFAELPQPADDGEFNVTFSCGVASLEPGESSQSLCERADRALYRAKQQGRNCVIAFYD